MHEKKKRKRKGEEDAHNTIFSSKLTNCPEHFSKTTILIKKIKIKVLRSVLGIKKNFEKGKN
jgi:hypothetical protein